MDSSTRIEPTFVTIIDFYCRGIFLLVGVWAARPLLVPNVAAAAVVVLDDGGGGDEVMLVVVVACWDVERGRKRRSPSTKLRSRLPRPLRPRGKYGIYD